MVISLSGAAHLISRRRARPGTSLCLCSSHRPLMNYLSKSVLWLHLVQFCVTASYFEKKTDRKHFKNLYCNLWEHVSVCIIQPFNLD